MRKELPILFSTEMVRAILDGRKTMTRRVVTKHNSNSTLKWEDFDFTEVYKNTPFGLKVKRKDDETIWRISPKWQPGDVLWTKETFTILDWWEDSRAVQVMYEDAKTRICELTAEEWVKFERWQEKEGRKSSLFMFKSLSRIWLEVTDVRVERLQEIGGEDAASEGFEKHISGARSMTSARIDYEVYLKRAKHWFEKLWQEINGEESWNQNPWVWCVSFRILSTNSKPELL